VSTAGRLDALHRRAEALQGHVDDTQTAQASSLDAMDAKLARTCTHLASLTDWKAEVLAVLSRDSQGAASVCVRVGAAVLVSELRLRVPHAAVLWWWWHAPQHSTARLLSLYKTERLEKPSAPLSGMTNLSLLSSRVAWRSLLTC
jgi:hypothetical protein